MPVHDHGDHYTIGSGKAKYKSKAAAERAYRAYMAKKHKKMKKQKMPMKDHM